MSIQATVDNAIAHKIAIFSKSWCPHCRAAKTLIAEEYKDEDVEVLELDERDDGAEIQNYLYEKTGQRTVPSIFVNQKHVGGNSDLQASHKAGKLKELVAGSA